jgi:hypothetical protein
LRSLAAELAAIGTKHGLPDLAWDKLEASDVVHNRLVYAAIAQAQTQLATRRGAAAANPPAPGEDADLSRAFDVLMHRTVRAYEGACTATTANVRGFRGNVFEFAGRAFFVDHDANYIVPDEEVGANRFALEGKVFIAGTQPKSRADLAKDPVRGLIDKYAYTGVSTSIDKFKQDAIFAAAGGTMEPKIAVMFLAGMVAEARRNPNAHITNLLLMSEGGKGPFFGAAPMTTGGTSAEEKFRDPTLAGVAGGNAQPPMTVSDAEIKLVRERYEATQGMSLADAVKTLGGEAACRDDLVVFLMSHSTLLS